MRRLTCAEVQELAAELALDLLTGTERAAALAHLERCTACRSEVGSLTDVGEAVLSLAPQAEPSAGFEIRVLDRIAAERAAGGAGTPADPPEPPERVEPAERAEPAEPAAPAAPTAPSPRGAAPPVPAPVPLGGRPPGRSRRRVLAGTVATAAAAAAVVVAVLVAGGDGDPGTGADDVVTAQAAAELRTGSGRVVGEATLTEGDPATVTLDMSDWMTEIRRYGDPHRTFWLTVDSGGAEDDVYGLPMGEPGPWHVRLDGTSGDGPVTSVAVVEDSGRSLCEARFATG